MKAFTLPGFEEPEDSSPGSDDLESETEYCSKPQDITVDDIPSYAAEQDTCFAYTLQLVIKDGLRQAGPITKVLGKASNIVSHVRRSIHASEILEGEKKLQAANATRWNSQLIMIRSLLRALQDKLQQLGCPQLSKYEYNMLEELVDILTPFENATHLLQGDKVVTSSLVVPCVRGLTTQLNQLQASTFVSLLVP